mmetsp:Transcript_50898/g.106343  ORF Transcript_50898/g.106343 Transcript_50898/m.106343 type:complete len:177 (-) Transcript_50898:451-981(-)
MAYNIENQNELEATMPNANANDWDMQAVMTSDEQLQRATSVNTSSGFVCILSKALMQDPVLIPESGYSYERKHIEVWLDSQMIDPFTGQELHSRNLLPNRSLQASIKELIESSSCCGCRQSSAAQHLICPSHSPPAAAPSSRRKVPAALLSRHGRLVRAAACRRRFSRPEGQPGRR